MSDKNRNIRRKVSNLSPQYWQGEDKPKGKPRIIPPHVIRNLAMNSREGGRGQCYFCKSYFSMTYLKMYKVTIFSSELVCRDCKKERNL